jgi:hypothetical protein
MKVCSIEGCERKHHGKGFCKLHYLKVWREANPEYNKTWYEANSERQKAAVKKWNKDNSERKKFLGKRWKEANTERYKANKKAWREANPERAQAATKKWREENVERYALSKLIRAKRRELALKTQTLKWSNVSEVEQFFSNCPDGMAVDHIIPIQGKEARGLNVIWNLRYIPIIENSKKHNKLLPEFAFGVPPELEHLT